MKKLFCILMGCIPWIAQAQVSISVQLPTGILQKEQLWNLILVNTSNTLLEATVVLDLKDATTGQSVLSAGTRTISLGKGVKLLTVQDVQPIQYNYGITGLGETYLPLGSYIACYSIIRNSSKEMEVLAEERVRVTVHPLSPPLLNSPSDKSVLKEKTPQFTWAPPTPLALFDNLNYTISLAEVHQGQTAVDALRQNIPVYVRSHLKQPYESYALTNSSLEAGKTYAWQVTVTNGLTYTAATETWTFTMAGDSSQPVVTSSSYLLLKNKNEAAGVSYIHDHTLSVKYYSFDKEHKPTVLFLNAEGKVIQEVQRKIIYGDNFLTFSLPRLFKQGEIYHIEITDLQNVIYTASFSIPSSN